MKLLRTGCWKGLSKLKRRVIIGLTIAIAVIAAIVAILAWSIYPMYSNQIEITEVVEGDELSDATGIELEQNDEIDEVEQTQDNIYKEEQKHDDIYNIVLSGVDTRNYNLNSRSDTIILASYNRTKHTIKLVSFMRDSWVYLPGRGWSRINTATVYGGTGLLINTLNENFDLDIQNYIQIKFDDFREIIDAIGGFDIELTKSEINYINNKLHVEDHDWSNDITAEPGIVHLNGAQALWHCRNRTIGNADFERTERQREVLSILIDKAMNMNIEQLVSLIFSLRDKINTNIPITTLAAMAYDAVIVGNMEVETARVPFDEEYSFANKNGASVLDIDIDENTKLLHEFLGYASDENELVNEAS